MRDEFNYDFDSLGDFVRFSLFSVLGIFVVIFSEIFEKSKSIIKGL